MLGNVWEWVDDCYEEKRYAGRPNPDRVRKAPETPRCARVLRGGSWIGILSYDRASSRDGLVDWGVYRSRGFRCAGDFPVPPKEPIVKPPETYRPTESVAKPPEATAPTASAAKPVETSHTTEPLLKPPEADPSANITAPKKWINPKDGLTYIWIRPGIDFTIGCSPNDRECYEDEKPSPVPSKISRNPRSNG